MERAVRRKTVIRWDRAARRDRAFREGEKRESAARR